MNEKRFAFNGKYLNEVIVYEINFMSFHLFDSAWTAICRLSIAHQEELPEEINQNICWSASLKS